MLILMNTIRFMKLTEPLYFLRRILVAHRFRDVLDLRQRSMLIV